VIHNRHPGPEKCDRAVALVHFTDENIALPNPGAGKRRVRADEVLHFRAIHDRWVSSGAVKNPPDHADRGGLAARSRDTDTQGGTVEELGEKMRASDDAGTDTTSGLHVGDRLFNSGGGDQYLRGSPDSAAILRMKEHPSSTQKIKSFGI